MTTKTKRLMVELQALLGPQSADELAEKVAAAELAVAAILWTLDGTIYPNVIDKVVRRLQRLPADARERVLAQAPDNLQASAQDLPARLEGLRTVLAEVLPRLSLGTGGQRAEESVATLNR